MSISKEHLHRILMNLASLVFVKIYALQPAWRANCKFRKPSSTFAKAANFAANPPMACSCSCTHDTASGLPGSNTNLAVHLLDSCVHLDLPLLDHGALAGSVKDCIALYVALA